MPLHPGHDPALHFPLSGPLLDRIDIHMDVPAVKYRELRGEESAESSAVIRERVERARALQLERFRRDRPGGLSEGNAGIYANAHMSTRLLRRHCLIDEASEKLLETAITRMGLSARAHDRIHEVARGITGAGRRPGRRALDCFPPHRRSRPVPLTGPHLLGVSVTHA